MHINHQLSLEEVTDLLVKWNLQIQTYMNWGEVKDSVNLTLDTINSKELSKKLINLAILKVFDEEWISRVEEILEEYQRKISR